MTDMSFSSNSVIARSRAIYGKSLTAADYSQLCAKKSVAEAAAYLKGCERYSEALAGINPQTIHRGQLEMLLSRTVFGIFESFHKFDFTESKWFFRAIVTRLEAVQLLRAVQAAANGSMDSYISSVPIFLDKRTRVNLLELGKAKDFGELLQKLSDSSYYAVLKPVLTEAAASGRVNISECERRLYTCYYLFCMKMLEKSCRGSQKTELKRVFLRSVDMKNVVTCCRMNAFGFDAAETADKLVPFRYRLTPAVVERLMQLDDISEIKAELDKIGYRTDSPLKLRTVEQLAESISLEFHRRTMRLSRSSCAVYFCLIECLEAELGNLKTIIEGIRYEMPADEIMKMLVL